MTTSDSGRRANLHTLSPREREVLFWYCEGLTRPEIAQKLHLVVSTVDYHLNHIHVKLGMAELSPPRHRILLDELYCPLLRTGDQPPRTPEGPPPQGPTEEATPAPSHAHAGWLLRALVLGAILGVGVLVIVLRPRSTPDEFGAVRYGTPIERSAITVTELYFELLDAAGERVRVRACTTGRGGVGITLRVSVNDSSDGSASGTWHIINELGVPCYNEVDAPIFRPEEWGGGSHLVRVEARGHGEEWSSATVREVVYTPPSAE